MSHQPEVIEQDTILIVGPSGAGKTKLWHSIECTSHMFNTPVEHIVDFEDMQTTAIEDGESNGGMWHYHERPAAGLDETGRTVVGHSAEECQRCMAGGFTVSDQRFIEKSYLRTGARVTQLAKRVGKEATLRVLEVTMAASSLPETDPSNPSAGVDCSSPTIMEIIGSSPESDFRSRLLGVIHLVNSPRQRVLFNRLRWFNDMRTNPKETRHSRESAHKTNTVLSILCHDDFDLVEGQFEHVLHIRNERGLHNKNMYSLGDGTALAWAIACMMGPVLFRGVPMGFPGQASETTQRIKPEDVRQQGWESLRRVVGRHYSDVFRTD